MEELEYDIENIIASTKIDVTLDLEKVSEALESSEYNPNSFPGVIYRFKRPRVVVLIFDDGKIMCTSARSLEDVETVFVEIINLLAEKDLLEWEEEEGEEEAGEEEAGEEEAGEEEAGGPELN